MQTKYGFGAKVGMTYEQAVFRVKELLQREGFGVLTEIDVKKTMKQKARRGVPEGCHFSWHLQPNPGTPRLRHRLEIGLLLPCNVIVYEDDSGALDRIAPGGVRPIIPIGFVKAAIAWSLAGARRSC